MNKLKKVFLLNQDNPQKQHRFSSLFPAKQQSDPQLSCTNDRPLDLYRPRSIQPSLITMKSSSSLPSEEVDKSQNEAYLQMGLKYHENGQLEKATYYWRLCAENGYPLGLFFYGIALRHGWGCKKNPMQAVQYLQTAAEFAVYDLQTTAATYNVAKSELVLAIHELGVCFRHGWGVPKNLETAAYYFQVASHLGDPDAQNDLGFCYLHGLGVKKDVFLAAKYYRMAEKQGQGIIGNSWIWKAKYDQVEEPGWAPKTDKKKDQKKKG
ncbi:Mitosis inhibitor nif1 [Choanephora cucurbitarum]|uniref:Mitosis inhibitor nif1 n=1 Tax=Choanephora cucurbitarum TaxID=101091 RepID=A0A1C7N3W6_9FUNG|nr:Mitosis inhibitor nif1 [Choanephora cucurbitarum]